MTRKRHRILGAPLALLVLLAALAQLGDCNSHGNSHDKRGRPSSLYDAADLVTPLNYADLGGTVYGKDGGRRVHWLLQIYHAYCGHCINYSGKFKKLARQLWPWRHTLRIGVINVADAANSQVMAHYDFSVVPTVIFVSTKCTWDDMYTAVLRPNTNWLPSKIMELLQPFVPQLAPLPPGSPIPDCDLLLEEAPPGVLARHVIMDTLATKNIRWRFLESSASEGSKDDAVIVRRVLAGGHLDPAPLGTVDSLASLRSLVGAASTEIAASDATAADGALAVTVKGAWMPSLIDLRSALVRALVSDAPLAGLHRPRVWHAVRDFVALVAELAPASAFPEVARLAAAMPASPPVTASAAGAAAAWKRTLTEAGLPETPPDNWDACVGSKPYLRGYPCGLWQVFHTLTALRVQLGSRTTPSVAPVMRRFIVACFSCHHCAKNFARESADIANLRKPMEPRAELLWLWRLHNRVNARLKGQLSEDPEHPKVEFPQADLCSECATNDDKAVQFLVKWYTAWI